MKYLQLLQVFLLYNFNTVLTKSPSVIIIGAGPSGIAAATKLLENSITNITIVEAQDRIGGRIHSIKFGSGHVDVGAQYCDGQEGNIVYDMVKDLDLLEHSAPSEFLKIYSSDGSTIDSEFKKSLFYVADHYAGNGTVMGSDSLGDVVLNRYNTTVIKQYENDPQKLKLATDAIRLLEYLILSAEGAFSWYRVPAGRHLIHCAGDHGLTWKIRGFHIILDILMKAYPDSTKKLPIDDKIVLNKKVEKIIWSNDRVEVKCADNSSLTADHVIFTPSAGVLKKHKDDLFEPKLPEEKLKALEAIGFNGIMKIILHFPQKWWNHNDSVFLFLWQGEDLAKITSEFPDGPNKNGVSWLASISAVTIVPHNPTVLIAWVTGDLVYQIEETPKDVLLRGSNYLIRRFLGKKYNVTDAEKVIKSQWNTNPNFYGTNSHEKVEHFRSDVFPQNILAEPLLNSKGHPLVQFAGEATHPTQYGSVHGAIRTGLREAERIIELHPSA